MKKEQIEYYRKAAEDGSLPDNENPIFLLSVTPTSLLLKIVNREIDVIQLAKMQLENRGLDLKGKWAGFKQAAEKAPRFRQRRKGRGI